MKKEVKGSAKLPKDHWEQTSELVLSGTGKYSEGSNPEKLKENVKGLESFVKGHKEKH